MRRRQHIWLPLSKHLGGLLLAVLLAGGGSVAADDGPEAVIEQLNAALLEAMRGAEELATLAATRRSSRCCGRASTSRS